MLRYTDISNHYTVRIRKPYSGDGSNSSIDLQKTEAGSTSTVTTVDLGEQVATGATWFVRARIVGSNIKARAWKSADSEPGTWDIDVTDTNLTTGNGWGARSIASPDVSSGTGHTVRYLSFDYDNLGTDADEAYVALEKREFGVNTDLAASVNITSPRTDVSQEYWIRSRFEAGTLYVKGWSDSDEEPEAWQITVADGSFSSGDVGLRGYLSPSVDTVPVNMYWSDYIVDARWDNPPTIVHNQWVRIMDSPFDPTGAGVPYRWLREKLVSDDEDVIVWATSYLSNVPITMSRKPSSRDKPSVVVSSGTKLAGETAYGSADSAGYRIEGADWNDYIGVDVQYPVYGSDPAEAYELEALDCSGFVRMVYGYRGGMPLERTASNDGVHIPRVSRDIELYGPGIQVFSLSVRPTQTEFDQLQVGDIISFDAGVGAPTEEEGEIDHNGIYLGVDTNGLHRFVSSRKTANGPTMSDIGGKSVVDTVLTNLYSVSFRASRRF
jgi:cell wall-associated NlpC family hydrolase